MTTDERILVLMPTAKDGERMSRVLAEAGLACAVCKDVAELCREIRLGAGAAILPEEAVVGDHDGRLAGVLRDQPPWSDFPLVVLAREGKSRGHFIRESMNATLVERPVKVRSLLSVVRAALRSRRHQYAVRDHLAERRNAEESLREKDARLQFALEAGRLGAWDLDLTTWRMECSDICKANFGRTPGEAFSYEDLYEAIHPDERAWVRAAFEAAIHDRSEFDVEYRTVWPDGGVHWVLVRGRAVYDREPPRMSGVSLDITDRKRTEVALRASEERYRVLVTASADVVYRMNADWTEMYPLDGRNLVASNAAPIRDWMQKNLPAFEHARVAKGIAAAIASKRPFEMEHQVVRPNFTLGWTHSRAAPILDERGEIVEWFGTARDVTDRKRAEEELARLAEALGLALAAADLGTWDWDPATDDMILSRRAAEIYGVDRTRALRREALRGLLHPDDRDRARAAAERAVADQADYDIEYRLQRPGADPVWVAARGRGSYDAAGTLVRMNGVVQDITARKRSEANYQRLLHEVDAERARLAEVFRHAPSFMCVLRGPDHVFERANDRYFELVGRRDIIGKPVRQAFPEVEGQGFFEILDHVFQSGEPFVGTGIRIKLMRGGSMEERVLEFVYQPMRDAEGAVSGVLAHGIDLTERVRAEEGLARATAEAERRGRMFDTALSHTADFVYMFDLAGRFTYVNKALLDLWGKDFAQAVGKNFFDLDYPPDLAARLQRQIEEVIETRQPVRDETPYASAAGTRAYEYIFMPIVGADGKVEAVAGSTRDITARKETEQLLREADRKKDDFLALLAHELRNPLAPIRNGLQVIRLSEDRQMQRGAQEMMDRQLSHMVRLIDDLLDVSRISRNKMELRRSRIALADVVNSAVETARPLIDAHRHELTVLLPHAPVYLDADLTRLAQVFGNLLTNSAKYTEPGGHIWLSAALRGSQAIVSVRDTGIGIPADSLGSIFDMFSQVDRSMERSTGGLGIGLALVKGLVEMHGGTITAASDGQGLGSLFTVTLPMLAGQHQQAVGGSGNGQAASGQQRRILVVDDNRDAADSLATMLTLLGNDVRTAKDGMAALEQAEGFGPEIILMDVGMPRLNGLDATRRIREQPWGRAITIIALTGWGQEGDKTSSREAGCNGHLVKPVSLPDLLKLLEPTPQR